MSNAKIIKAAERALEVELCNDPDTREVTRLACAVLVAVTPLIRDAALEEAGQAAMDCDVSQCDAYMARREIAVAIKAFKEQP